MKYHDPLRQILSRTRSQWDRNETYRAARGAFSKALKCRTAELGAEVYSSENQELVLYHTCKSRACPSCGYRNSVQWLRERWVALPEQIYKGITFTMPDVLWPFFRDNPRLTRALSALAAKIIEARVSGKYGVRVGVIAILHTFNGKLEFNSHVHTMVTGGGLRETAWVHHVYYDQEQLMKSWRRAVIQILRAALRAAQLRTEMTEDQVRDMLTKQEKRGWIIKIQSFQDRGHFLKYAGRYVRRPPIAQRRIILIEERTVRFWYKDKELGQKVILQCSLQEFLDRWSQHIPGRYQHAVRSFGLFAPRLVGHTCAAVFAILGQERKPRPKPRPWAQSIKRDFGYDPLLDRTGKQMKWVRRLSGGL